MTAADATRLAGEGYRTRLAQGEAATLDDKTRLAQEGYRSRLARDAAGAKPEKGEFYKVGDKIGDRYEVSAIHHGELGVVYGCFDHRTKLPRALKTVRARHAGDKQVLALFESEAAVWISLERHPYIVRAYLVERFKNLPYVITEYVRGPEGMEGDLRGWLGHPRLTLPVAVAMALQIAQGMQHAVRKVPDLVHRDLKPGNLLVNGDGKAMVTDFGLVYAGQSGAGTPAYMSPEQWREEALDARSDIYAYGCILFEMFTGHRLFPAMTERDWERAHLEGAPAALNGIVSAIPGEIDQFVRRCLAKNPKERPQHWDEIVTFFAEWYHRLTGKAVVLDFSSLALDASEWVNASYSFSNLRRYPDVLMACDRALAIDPNMATAWSNKGWALQNLQRYEEALQAYDRALAIEPDDADTWNGKGFILKVRLHRYEEAIQAYDRVLAIDPNDADAWELKAVIYKDIKRYEDAIQAYEQSLGIDPHEVGRWVNMAEVLEELKRYEEAIHAYDQALSFSSRGYSWSPSADKTLYEATGRQSDLEQDPEIAKETESELWSLKGNALGKLKRYEAAIQAYDRVLTIDPKHHDAWRNKGTALLKLKRYEEGIQAYDGALSIYPDDVLLWGLKGVWLYSLERYKEALHAFERALAIAPENVGYWGFKGDALRMLEQNDEAIDAYDRALALDPNDTDVWNSKGNMLQSLKRYDDAMKMYAQALNIDENDESALEGFLAASDALKAGK